MTGPDPKAGPPLGVVLAGGPGRRMGGNKPLRLLGGKRLIDWALTAVAQVCPRQVVVTGDPAQLTKLPCPIIRDRWPGQGPLAAIATAFLDTNAQSLLVLAVDLPLARTELLELLLAGPESDWARAPLSPGGMEPLVGYYHRKCLPTALRLIESGERRPRMLLQEVKARFLSIREVAQVDPDGISLFNINYPEDLEKAAELGRARGLFDTLA